MWFLTVTPSQTAVKAGAEPHTLRIPGNSVNDLLIGNADFRWSVLESLMEKGLLQRVEIDYRPSMYGVKGVKKIGDLYYLTVDREIASRGFATRREAWESWQR